MTDRMTVGALRDQLTEWIDDGRVSEDAVIFVDSDPEGNDINPLASEIDIALSPDGEYDDDVEPERPALAIWIGVTY